MEALAGELYRLELALAARDENGIDGGLMSLIADDFVEFGSSGTRWDRESVRSLLALSAPQPPTIDQFEIAELCDGAVLTTYSMPGPPATNRSSVWVRRGGRWLIRFHQGTPRPE